MFKKLFKKKQPTIQTILNQQAQMSFILDQQLDKVLNMNKQ